MKIVTYKYSNNADVSVEIDNAKFELGFHSKQEALELASELLSAADDLIGYFMDEVPFNFDEVMEKINET